MNVPGIKTTGSVRLRASAAATELGSDFRDPDDEAERKGPSDVPPASSSQRVKARVERHIARGYSINIKQVVLAFVVEFVIIGLILVSQFVYAAEIPNASKYKIVAALLFPIALAMVELARVPLALAVRTQDRWYIKLVALVGVMSAVVVTSVSLSNIGHLTFNPRLEDAHEKQSRLRERQDEKTTLVSQIEAAQDVLNQKIKDRDTFYERYKSLTLQLNAQPGQNCYANRTNNLDGSSSTRQACRTNPALKPLQDEIAATKVKINEAEVGVKQAQEQVDRTRVGLPPLDELISKAETEYREGIYQSQLHAYTAMFFRKDPREVSDGEVKTLQWYLIVIPSIAAALSSTLIAMTAVRRFKKPAPQTIATLPDEAVAYLFGPLVDAIKAQAKDAVAAAIEGGANAKSVTGASAPAGA